MSESPTTTNEFHLGALRIDPARNRLVSDQDEFHLEPRVMDVLCVLAEQPGGVVARETLISRLWTSEFGADESLTRAVSLIRKALREAGESNGGIETIKKRGYRLTLPVAPIEQTQDISSASMDSPRQIDGTSRSNPANRNTGRLVAAVVLIATAVLLLTVYRGSGDPPGDRKGTSGGSVAVLPFEALSRDESDAYFGAGIAEEILNALSRFPDLKVIARTSAFTLNSTNLDSSAIGSQLGVENLVTGSVRRDGERIRISAQLVRAADGESLWANTYEVDAAGLFAVEDEIVRDVAQTLQIRLGIGAAAGRNDGTGIEPLAYDQYLQGLRFLGDRMRDNGNREAALAAFQRAVSFDPDFADAWAGIGTIGVYSVGSPLSRDREAFFQMTLDALTRAIALDPDNAKAHASLTMFYAMQKIDVGAARYHLQQAQAAAPNAATTHYAAAVLHRALADAEASLAAFDRTMALDPLNPVIAFVRADLLIEIGRFEDGMAFFEECFQSRCLSEGFVAYASAAAVFTGNEETMATWLPRVTAFEKQLEDIPDHQKPIVARIMPTFFSIRLQRSDAQEQIEQTRRLFDESLITDTTGIWAPTFARFLDQEIILDTLHEAYERGDLFSAVFAYSPMYGANPYPDWLLAHPRYHELWQRPGMEELAEHWRKSGYTAGLPTSGSGLAQKAEMDRP